MKKKLENVIYLTGPAASGKSTLIRLMDNASEINVGENTVKYSKVIEKGETYNTLVFTAQSRNIFTAANLRRICKEQKLLFLEIRL